MIFLQGGPKFEVTLLRSALTHENIQVIEELICSQEGQPILAKGGYIEHHLD